jgi:hypothetical protein
MDNRYLFQGAGLGAGVAALGDAIYGARDRQENEAKQRAREFTSLQAYADAAGIVPKAASTPMDLETLRGIVAGQHTRRTLEAEGINLESVRSLAKLRSQQADQAAELFPEQLRQLRQANEYQGSIRPLQQQALEQDNAAQAANIRASADARSAVPEFLQALQDEMNPPATPPMLPTQVGMPEAMPAALARVPGIAASPQGVNLINVIDRLAQMKASNRSSQLPVALDVGGQKVIYVPATGATHVVREDDPGELTVSTGPEGTTVKRRLNKAESQTFLADQQASEAATAVMEPALRDAYEKYRAAADKIAQGNRYTGPEFLGLGDRQKTASAEGGRLAKLVGRPPEQWTPQQHAVLAAGAFVPPPPAGKIVVVGPDGARAYLPTAQWPEAQRQGYLMLPFGAAKENK